jgi:hypothetical protein
MEFDMKNALKIVIFMMLAAVLFVSCGQATGGNGSGADVTPLFNESEASVPINSISINDLSDGEWEFMNSYYSNHPNYTSSLTVNIGNGNSIPCDCTVWRLVIRQTLTVSGGAASGFTGTETCEYTMNAANKATLDAFAATKGVTLNWNGNTVVISRNYTSNYWFNDMVSSSTSSSSSLVLKKNPAGTCFFRKTNYDRADSYDRYYLRKN